MAITVGIENFWVGADGRLGGHGFPCAVILLYWISRQLIWLSHSDNAAVAGLEDYFVVFLLEGKQQFLGHRCRAQGPPVARASANSDCFNMNRQPNYSAINCPRIEKDSVYQGKQAVLKKEELLLEEMSLRLPALRLMEFQRLE